MIVGPAAALVADPCATEWTGGPTTSPGSCSSPTAAAVRRAIQGAFSEDVAGGTELDSAFDAVTDDALAAERPLVALCGTLFRPRVEITRLRRVISLIGLPGTTRPRSAGSRARSPSSTANAPAELPQFIGVLSAKTGTEVERVPPRRDRFRGPVRRRSFARSLCTVHPGPGRHGHLRRAADRAPALPLVPGDHQSGSARRPATSLWRWMTRMSRPRPPSSSSRR